MSTDRLYGNFAIYWSDLTRTDFSIAWNNVQCNKSFINID